MLIAGSLGRPRGQLLSVDREEEGNLVNDPLVLVGEQFLAEERVWTESRTTDPKLCPFCECMNTHNLRIVVYFLYFYRC